MSWSFTADSDIQDALAKSLNDAADDFDLKVGEVYSIIAGMSGDWKGSDYDTFVTNTNGYKDALADLAKTMRMFAIHYGYVSQGTTNLASSCVSIIQSIINGGAGGTGAGNGQQGAGAGQQGAGQQGTGQQGAGTWSSYQDAAAAGYPGVMTENEYNRHKASNDPTIRDYATYQDYLAAKQAEFTGATAPNPTGDGTQNPTGTGTQNPNGPGTTQAVDNRPQYTSGDPVKINGQDYHVYGYVTGSDGKSVGIYEGTDGKLYYFDSTGARQNVTGVNINYSSVGGYSVPFETTVPEVNADWTRNSGTAALASFGTAIVINGVQYKVDDISATGYSAEGVAANPTGGHSSYDNVNTGTTVSENTYTSMAESNHGAVVSLADHDGSSRELAVPSNYSAVKIAVNNQQPIKIQAGHTLTVDVGAFGEKRYFGGTKETYLVYHNGKYYEADATGNILNYNNGVSPGCIINGWGIGNGSSFN